MKVKPIMKRKGINEDFTGLSVVYPVVSSSEARVLGEYKSQRSNI